MPILMGASARAEMMKGAANWARPATAPALTKVRRSRAREPRRLSICPSLRVASQWAILIDDLGLAAQGPTRGWGEPAQPDKRQQRIAVANPVVQDLCEVRAWFDAHDIKGPRQRRRPWESSRLPPLSQTSIQGKSA